MTIAIDALGGMGYLPDLVIGLSRLARTDQEREIARP
jgi:hypothetical protein